MTTLVGGCQCRTCVRHRKVTSQRGAAEHIGMAVKDFRAAVRDGEGPRAFNPTDRRNPRYAITVLDAWVFGRDDTRGAA